VPQSILVVDDDPEFRELAVRLLTATGLTIARSVADVGPAS